MFETCRGKEEKGGSEQLSYLFKGLKIDRR